MTTISPDPSNDSQMYEMDTGMSIYSHQSQNYKEDALEVKIIGAC